MEEVEVEAVPWLPDPVVSMCRLRPSVPVKLKVIVAVLWSDVVSCGVMWCSGVMCSTVVHLENC